MTVTVFGVSFRNPVLLASGTAGYGREVAGVADLDRLGGIATKAVSLEPRAGNAAPRVAESGTGMLNSVGLANPGMDAVRDIHLPWLAANAPGLRVLVNVVGNTVDDFAGVVAGLRGAGGVSGFELNVSCPNVERGGIEFGADAATLGELVRRARAETGLPLIVKLSPVLSDPARTAAAAVAAGADGFTCINTLPALAFHDDGTPRLGNRTGGLSGPPLLPAGVRITSIVARETGKPVIGAGGISCAADARQYLRAGAALVAIGTASFADPRVPERVAAELEGWSPFAPVGNPG